MEKLRFLVQGSSPEPYEVVFTRQGVNLTATCTCPAGTVGQNCKNRFALMAGESTGVVGGDTDKIESVVEMLDGTDVAEALAGVNAAEERLADAKKILANYKKKLARAMRD